MDKASLTKDKLKIIYLLASTEVRGGIKIQIQHCNQLATLGHDVSILSVNSKPDWINVDVPWVKQEIPQGEILGTSLPACDLAIFSFYEQAYALQAAASRQDFIPIYFAQGDEMLFGDPDQAEDPVIKSHITAARNSLKFYYPTLTVSHSAASRLVALGAESPQVIHNGIDLNVFRPGKTSKHDSLRILAVGSETPRFKGIAELYAALIKLKQDPQLPTFTFVRASPQPNRFARLPLETEFHLNPAQADLANIYASADIFVGPSQNESFYLPPLEAMASGTAVICSDLPSIREFASPGRDLLSFTPGNISEMYSQIKKLLGSEELRNTLVKNGLIASGKFAWSNIVNRLETYFFQLLDQKEEIMGKIRKDIDKPPFNFTLGRL